MGKITVADANNDSDRKPQPVAESSAGATRKLKVKSIGGKAKTIKVQVEKAKAEEPTPPVPVITEKVSADETITPVESVVDTDNAAEEEVPVAKLDSHALDDITFNDPEQIEAEIAAAAQAAADKEELAKAVEPAGQLSSEEQPAETVEEKAAANEDTTQEPLRSTDIKPTTPAKKPRGFRHWWRKQGLTRGLLELLAAVIFLLAVVPGPRYYILNALGVRSQASLTVLDEKTHLPLKQVSISLAGRSVTTDEVGVARLSGLKLGNAELSIEKSAFAGVRHKVTLGLWDNNLGTYQLAAIGTRLELVITDWVSKQPLSGAEASVTKASALSNQDGQASLVLPNGQSLDSPVTVKRDGYRTEQVRLPNGNVPLRLTLTPSRKHIFIDKRLGKYDVYRVHVDGKNEEKLLGGTGNERDDITLLPKPLGDLAALIASRDVTRGPGDILMSGLFIVDGTAGPPNRLVVSERIRLVGWTGDWLVYTYIDSQTAKDSAERERLAAYNVTTKKQVQLATGNYFNDVLIANDAVYYAPSGAYLPDPEDAKFYRIKPDGTSRRSLVDREVWKIIRTEYEALTIVAGPDRFKYNLVTGAINKQPMSSVSPIARIYQDSPNNMQSLWMETQDGQTALTLHDRQQNTDRTLFKTAGLTMPLTWLDGTHAVVHVSTAAESADYVIDTKIGKPIKIRDVSRTGSIDDWYFYQQ